MRNDLRFRRRAGLTLLELLVVTAIIGVLAALLLPAVQRAREAANRVSCVNNLKQLGLASLAYHDAQQTFPHMYGLGGGDPNVFVWILPYLEQQGLYGQYDVAVPEFAVATQPSNLANENSWYRTSDAVRRTQIKSYYCPSRGRFGSLSKGESRAQIGAGPFQGALGDYAGNMGVSDTREADGGSGPLTFAGNYGTGNNGSPAINKGQWVYPPLSIKDITDGTANTLLMGEKQIPLDPANVGAALWGDEAQLNSDNNAYFRYAGPGCGPASGCCPCPLAKGPKDGQNINEGPFWFGSPHAGVVLFVFCDGHVQSVNVNTDITTLGYLACRNDGKAITVEY